MKVIGLTGGIGGGKSAVAAMLRDLGAEVIDADQVAREVVEPGHPAYHDIKQRWPQCFDAQGVLDRKALGALVFKDAGERAALNAIVHPRIAAEVARRSADLYARGAPAVVYEAALLVENNLHKGMDALIVVDALEETRLQRVIARDGLARAEAEDRLRAQIPDAERRAAATHVVDNSGTLEDTRRQVERIWRQIASSS
jgi:dephospho-CoA kinase